MSCNSSPKDSSHADRAPVHLPDQETRLISNLGIRDRSKKHVAGGHSAMSVSIGLVASLAECLESIQLNPWPHVPNPPDCQKRASVALVLRIRPDHSDSAVIAARRPQADENHESLPETSADFFAQSWVQRGDPEILFIKRAGRVGDRWSGHIALPGGKRDPLDVDDRAAAIRETKEEVGLDLSCSDCFYAGNLPERVVTTTWGKKGLMVLCPFIFILTSPTSPSLLLQPTEVAATHWVPLRALLSSSLRTRELVDISSRFGKKDGPVLRYILRLMLGKMMFSAVRLIPSESIFASSIPGFIPDPQKSATPFAGLARGSFGLPSSTTPSGPLLLWGLTLGILADLLDMFPPHNAIELWQYPTFTSPDLRLLVYLFTYKLRQDNARHLSDGTWPSQTAVDASTAAVAVSEAEPHQAKLHGVGRGGIGAGNRPSHALSLMLSGYYERVNVAIAVFLAMRIAAICGLGYYAFRTRKLWRR